LLEGDVIDKGKSLTLKGMWGFFLGGWWCR